MKPRSRLSIAVVLTSALVAGVPAAGAQDPEPTDETTTAPEVVAPAPAASEEPVDELTPEEPKAPGADRAAPGDDRRPSTTSLRLKGLKGGKLTVGKKLTAAGTLRPFVQGVEGDRAAPSRQQRRQARDRPGAAKKGADYGKFSYSKKLVKPGRYSVEAIHKKNATPRRLEGPHPRLPDPLPRPP